MRDLLSRLHFPDSPEKIQGGSRRLKTEFLVMQGGLSLSPSSQEGSPGLSPPRTWDKEDTDWDFSFLLW